MSVDVKKIWDACGAAFDRFTSAEDSFSENIERPVIESLAGDVAGQRVLDLGCGSGVYSLSFAERRAHVTGLDLSPVMIELTSEKAREQSLALDLRVADISRPLPFDDAQFDLVFTATVLHYVKDLASFFREASRVIKPKGCLIASVLHPVATAYFPLAHSEETVSRDQWHIQYFGADVRMIETPWIDFGDVSNEGRQIISYHHTLSDYFAALASSGLRITDLREPQPPSSFAEKNIARYKEAMSVPVYLIFKAINSSQ
jgi:ubiquinone/menaquinone biosynthesis C-methylase UbiE